MLQNSLQQSSQCEAKHLQILQQQNNAARSMQSNRDIVSASPLVYLCKGRMQCEYTHKAEPYLYTTESLDDICPVVVQVPAGIQRSSQLLLVARK